LIDYATKSHRTAQQIYLFIRDIVDSAVAQRFAELTRDELANVLFEANIAFGALNDVRSQLSGA